MASESALPRSGESTVGTGEKIELEESETLTEPISATLVRICYVQHHLSLMHRIIFQLVARFKANMEEVVVRYSAAFARPEATSEL